MGVESVASLRFPHTDSGSTFSSPLPRFSPLKNCSERKREEIKTYCGKNVDRPTGRTKRKG